MKRLLGILTALLIGSAASAQVRVDESVAIGYNRSFGMYEDNATMVNWLIRDRLDIRGGLRLQSNLTATEFGSRYYFNDSFGAEGFYIGQRSRELAFREYNIGVLGLWRWQDQVEVKAGTFFKWLKPLKGEGSVAEPFNFAYSVSFWALNAQKRFNVGGSLSTLDMFTAERFYCPMLTVKLRYRINDKFLIYLNFREHNSGIFDLTSIRYDRQFRVGTVITW
ncbi:MAG: hypothetical protein IKR38_02580 [Bacteroidales bacterium]|nr:hypothetical protein [Bacteroidales bacterium]